MDVLQSQADAARAKSRYMNRAVLNEMLIIVMVESGLRVSEVCNLRLKSLPSYHGHQALEVLNAKGEKDRTVTISDLLTERLGDYVRRYHGRHSIESFLFRSENGGRLSPDSAYCKVKLIGLKARIWVYRKNGRLRTKLSPHKFRHTNATHLLDVTGSEFLVKDQLGHEKTDTTHIYARTLTEKLRSAMNAFSKRIWSNVPDKNASDINAIFRQGS
jgi:integrase/recombinase XerC